MASRNISTSDLARVGVYVWTFPAFLDAIERVLDARGVSTNVDEVVDLWGQFTGRMDNMAEHVLDDLASTLIESKSTEGGDAK